MRIIGSKVFRAIVVSGVAGGVSIAALSGKPEQSVHAATKPAVHAAQVASPEDQRTQAGLPPNLDWSIFLPPGEGQFQASVYCVSCHSAKTTVTRRSDAAGWNQIVHRMIDMHNAPIQPDDAAVLAKYLGDALSPTTPVLNLPLHVNTVSRAELNFLGMLSPDAIQKIEDARSKAKIKDFAELKAITGDKNIDKYKSVLAFD